LPDEGRRPMLSDAVVLVRILHTTYIFSLPVNSAATAVLPRLLFVWVASMAVGGSGVLNPTGKRVYDILVRKS
jgi:hypothetical protein